MRRSRAAIAAALFTVLALLPLAAAPVLAKDHDKAERERVFAYWTRERIENAKPRDFVRTPGGSFAAGKPAKPGGGTRRRDGCVVDQERRDPVALRQGRVHDGRRGLRLLGDRRHRQSQHALPGPHRGSLRVRRGRPRIRHELDVHPAVRHRADVQLRADGLRVLDRDRPRRPQRVRHGRRVQRAGDRPRLRDRDRGRRRQDARPRTCSWTPPSAAPGSTLQTSGVAAGNKLYAFGYPAAGRYKGKDLTYCAGNIFTDQYNDDQTWGMACNMTGGSSGGPWLASFNETTGVGHPELAQLVRLQRPQQHVRPEVQRATPRPSCPRRRIGPRTTSSRRYHPLVLGRHPAFVTRARTPPGVHTPRV